MEALNGIGIKYYFYEKSSNIHFDWEWSVCGFWYFSNFLRMTACFGWKFVRVSVRIICLFITIYCSSVWIKPFKSFKQQKSFKIPSCLPPELLLHILQLLTSTFKIAPRHFFLFAMRFLYNFSSFLPVRPPARLSIFSAWKCFILIDRSKQITDSIARLFTRIQCHNVPHTSSSSWSLAHSLGSSARLNPF